MSIKRAIPLLLLSFLFFLSPACPLGINCSGSSFCKSLKWRPDSNGSTNLIEQMRYLVGLNLTKVYLPGDHIVCMVSRPLGGICLFTQGLSLPEEGTNGSVIYNALGRLLDHGCTKCGSVPLSGNDDPDEVGYVTSNYVISGVCRGICPPPQPETSDSAGLFGREE